MKNSTFSAQVANNLLTLLQGYSKTIRLLLVMFLTLTVTTNAWAETVFSDEFSNVGTSQQATVSNRTGWSNFTNCYGQYNSGIRMGTSSKTGSITKTAMTNIEGSTTLTVTFYLAKYNSDSGKMNITVSGGGTASTTTFTPAGNAGVTSTTSKATWTDTYKCTFTIENATSATTIKFATSSKRLILGPVTISTPDADPDEPGTPTPSLSATPTTIDFGTVYQGATVDSKTVTVNFENLTGNVTYSGLSSPFTATGTVSTTGDKITIAADASTIGDNTQTLTITSAADSKTAEVTVKMNVVEKPAPTGTFTLHTGALVEGDYVIVYDANAMNNTVTSNRLQYNAVTISNNEIVDPLVATIWHIAPEGEYWTIYSEDATKYAASTSSKNQATLVASISDNAKWTVTKSENTFDFVNLARSTGSDSGNKYLRKNTTYGFACYAEGTGGYLSLYRKAGTKYNVTVSATTNGTVTASPTSAEAGTTITLTVEPTTGYVLNTLTVTDASSNTVTVTDNTFTMPASDVTVTATFKLNEKPAATLTLSKNGETEDITGNKQDDVITLPTTIDNDCVKQFVGWSADANCATAPEYAPGASYTLTSTSQTLYAVYATVEGGGEATASVNMATYATDNSWGSSSSTNQKEININSDLKAVISEGGNSGKYYNDGVRIYQSENATVTVSTTVGELKSVKFTFTIENNGTLLHEDVAMTSDMAVEVSGTSAVFSVGDTHATENKGQVRFTAIEVVYTGGATYSNYSTTCSAALANPTFSLAEGKYTEAKSVTISAAEGTIYYTMDGTTPTASSTQYTTAIALNDCGEYTIKAIAISSDSQSDVVSATYTIKLPLTNSQAAPYTEAEAIAVYDGGCYDNQDVYVKGTVKTATFNSTYGNYTITLTNGFQFYRFLQAAETKFTEDIIIAGDTLVACGKLSKYNTTYQLAEGCYLVERKPYTEPKTDISNTEATAYTVDKAFELIADVKSDLTKEVYVKGYVSVAPTSAPTAAGKITYSISDNGENTGNVLKIYLGLDIDGAAFTSKDDVKLGDYVVVKGKLLDYSSTYELTDNQLVQHIPAATISIENITMEVGETKSIAATITPDAAESAVTYSIKENTANAISLSGNTLTALAEGTATITATIATAAEYVGTSVDFTVTVTPKNIATLPFTFDGGKDKIEGTPGMSQNGLGSDYGSAPLLKFDGTDDYVIIHFDGEPGTLQYDIKGNGFSGGTFTVQESEDGNTYTDLVNYTELAGSTSTQTHTLSYTSRYVKFIYTTKSSGNVALGNIKIYSPASQLETPTGLEATNVTHNSATLSWGEVANASSYLVTIVDGGDLRADIPNTQTSHTFEGLTPSTKYLWTVKAIGDGITYTNSEESETGEFTTSAAASPATITLSELGVPTTDNTTYYVGETYTLPTTSSQSCAGKQLVGWSTVEVAETDTKPTENYYELGAKVTLAETQTFYAVFATSGEGGIDDTDYSNVHTSNVALDNTGGTNATNSQVKIGEIDYTAVKAGTGSASGAVKITVPTGTTKLSFHIAGWNKEGGKTISLTGATATPSSFTTVADAGVSGSSTTYTLSGTIADYFYSTTLSNINTETTLTFSNGGADQRFVIWGVNASTGGGVSYSAYTTSCGTYTVTFYGFNSGGYTTTCNGNPAEVEVAQGGRYTIPTCTPTEDPQGLNRTFAGTWVDDKGNSYKPGDSFEVIDDITLYAQWTWNTNTIPTDDEGIGDLATTDIVVTGGNTLTLAEGTTTINSLTLKGGLQENGTYAMPVVNIPTGATLVRNNNKINLDLKVNNNSYYPFAVPFEVANTAANVNYINPTLKDYANKNDGYGKYYRILEYNGAGRADNGVHEDNWVHVGRTDVKLIPGKGYAISAVPASGQDTVTIRITMTVDNAWLADGEQESITVKEQTTTRNAVEVTAYTGEAAEEHQRHAGWNFVANPYLAKFAGSNVANDVTYIKGSINIQNEYTYEDTEVTYVTVPAHDFSYYEQFKLSTTKLSPAYSFFVQVGGTGGTMTFETTGRQQAPASIAARNAEERPVKMDVDITLSDNHSSDQTGIIISDRYSDAYEIGRDLEKLFGSAYNLSVYTLMADNTPLAFQALAIRSNMQVIPVGYRAPEQGEYTFRLNEATSSIDLLNEQYEQLVLVDYQTGELTNLLISDYTFYSERTQADNRFAIYAVPRQNAPTDLPNAIGQDKQAQKIIHNGHLYILRDGNVYNGNGQIVK